MIRAFVFLFVLATVAMYGFMFFVTPEQRVSVLKTIGKVGLAVGITGFIIAALITLQRAL